MKKQNNQIKCFRRLLRAFCVFFIALSVTLSAAKFLRGVVAMVLINSPASTTTKDEDTANTQDRQQQHAETELLPTTLHQQNHPRKVVGVLEFPAPSSENLTPPPSPLGPGKGRYPTQLTFPRCDPLLNSQKISSGVGNPLPPQGCYPTRLVFNHW